MLDALDLVPFPDVLKDVAELERRTEGTLEQTMDQKETMSTQMTGMLQDKFAMLSEKGEERTPSHHTTDTNHCSVLTYRPSAPRRVRRSTVICLVPSAPCFAELSEPKRDLDAPQLYTRTPHLQSHHTTTAPTVMRRSARLPDDFNAGTPLRSNLLGQTPEWVFEGNQSLDSHDKFRVFSGDNKYERVKDVLVLIPIPRSRPDDVGTGLGSRSSEGGGTEPGEGGGSQGGGGGKQARPISPGHLSVAAEVQQKLENMDASGSDTDDGDEGEAGGEGGEEGDREEGEGGAAAGARRPSGAHGHSRGHNRKKRTPNEKMRDDLAEKRRKREERVYFKLREIAEHYASREADDCLYVPDAIAPRGRPASPSFSEQEVDDLRRDEAGGDTGEMFHGDNRGRREGLRLKRHLQQNIPLVLHLVAERIRLVMPGDQAVYRPGYENFKHYLRSPLSCDLLEHTYWYIHVRCFQAQEQGPAYGNHVGALGGSGGGGGESGGESGDAGNGGGEGMDGTSSKDRLLVDLMTLISRGYVKLLGSIKNRIHHAAFFRFYPFALAECVYQCLRFLCPGSRGALRQLRHFVYMEVVVMLCGVDVCPVSIIRMHAVLFNKARTDWQVRVDSRTSQFNSIQCFKKVSEKMCTDQ
jgi:hypothetical protein